MNKNYFYFEQASTLSESEGVSVLALYQNLKKISLKHFMNYRPIYYL